jgi:hypothetical protein
MSRIQISSLSLFLVSLFFSACSGGTVSPANGAMFNGTISTGEKAKSGTISFSVSQDGTSLTQLGITLDELKCGALTIGRIHDNLGEVQVSLVGGSFSGSIPALGAAQFTESQDYSMAASPFDFTAFEDMSKVNQLDGKFTSATHASGTIHLYVQAVMTDRACELGEFTWEADSP